MHVSWKGSQTQAMNAYLLLGLLLLAGAGGYALVRASNLLQMHATYALAPA